MLNLMGIFIDVVGFIIAVFVLIWLLLFTLDMIIPLSNFRGKRKVLKMIKSFKIKLKLVQRYLVMFFGMLINFVLSALLAIGSIPIIYKVNADLVSQEYATFASYIVAIGLFTLLPKWGFGNVQGVKG